MTAPEFRPEGRRGRGAPIACLLASAALAALAGCAATGTPAPPSHAYVDSCDPRLQPQRACVVAPVSRAVSLGVGQSTTARVDAQCRWNRTGVLLEPNGRYAVRVTKVSEPWRDKNTPSDLTTGWTGGFAPVLGTLARALARDVHSPMYALVGARGKDAGDYVLLGERAEIGGNGSSAVELLAFANDWAWMYRNNHGCVELTVTRQR